MGTRLAAFISTLGHPLLTTAVLILGITFHLFDASTAAINSALIIGGVIVPVTIWNYHKSRKGVYTNFDVSVRTDRSSMYLFMIGMLSLIAAVLFITGQPASLLYGTVTGLALIIVSFLVNAAIKTSLHAALSFYLSFGLLALSSALGLAMLGFSVLVGYSRVVLGRHTFAEIVVGSMLGVSAGLVLHLFIRP